MLTKHTADFYTSDTTYGASAIFTFANVFLGLIIFIVYLSHRSSENLFAGKTALPKLIRWGYPPPPPSLLRGE